MRRLIYLILPLALLLSGCFDVLLGFPEHLTEPQSPELPEQIVLPEAAPRAVTFGVAYSPNDSKNPLLTRGRHNIHMARLVYESLFELDENFVPQPMLATSLATEDNISLTFRLRRNVYFHDGSLLTPEDVVNSINIARSPQSPYAGRLSGIASVSALENGAVLVVMNSPAFNPAALFDFPIIRMRGTANIALDEDIDAEEISPDAPYGTGSYLIVTDGVRSYLRIFNNWWGTRAENTLPRIELVPLLNADTLVYSFQHGNISMLPHDPWDTFSPGIHAGFDRISIPSGLMQFIGINQRSRPLDQNNFRRALSLAIDREAIVFETYGTCAVSAVLPMPPAVFYSERETIRHSRDLARARELLETVRNVPELDFIVSDENRHRLRIAELAAENLREAGIEVNLRPLSAADFQTALDRGDFDLYYAEAHLSPNLDPREFLLPGGAFAFGVSESGSLRQALNTLAAHDLESETNNAPFRELWNAFYEETPLIVVCFRNTLFISQRGRLSEQTPAFFNPFRGFAGWEARLDWRNNSDLDY